MNKLAIGSHDNMIYLYNCDATSYTKTWKLKAHSSYITCLDWSEDQDWIRSCCGAYELLFFSGLSEEPSKEHQVKKNAPGGASATCDTHWSDHSCKFGWYVDSIFPAGTDGTHVNAVRLSADG